MSTFAITPGQFVGLWLAVVTVTFGVAAAWRRSQRLPFFQPKFPEFELRENWLSGASSVGPLGRLAWANNCLWFVLTRDALRVGLHFPFNLFIPSFMAKLDLDIPLRAITSVSQEKALMSRDCVRIAYAVASPRTSAVRTQYVDLCPKRADEFTARLREKVRAARGGAVTADRP